LLLSVFSFFAALLTKETAAVLPAAFVAYEYLQNKKISVKKIMVFAVPISAYLLMPCMVFENSIENAPFSVLFNSFLSSFAVTLWYFGAAFLSGKVPLYPQFDITFFTLTNGLLAFAAISLLLFVFRKKINFKRMAFAFLWFVIFLVPTYLMPANNYYAHRLYIPMFGIMIISADIFMAAYESFPEFKKFFYALPILIILLFSAMSYNQSKYYSDRKTFWMEACGENPDSYKTNAGLSAYYESAEDIDKAEKHILAAIELGKNKGGLLLQAGSLYYHKKDYAKASQYFIDAITENKYLEDAYLCLSDIHLELGNKKNAVEILKKALAIVPQSKRIQNAIQLIDGGQK
jgi:tetratricopeptide (TPR) repeat protein